MHVHRIQLSGWYIAFQAEEGSVTAATDNEGEEEERRKAKAKERIEAGGAAAVFGFSTLTSCLCFPSDARHANSVPFAICVFLAFCTFVSGNCLMLLNVNLLGLRADLVSGGQYLAAKCLVVSSAAFAVLTLLSLVALPGRRLYRYIGLAAVTAILLPAAFVHWYLRRHTGGGGDEEAAVANGEEHNEELEAAWNITTCITNSAFGGLVGVLFSVSKISDAVDTAAYVAIFFMFSTAIVGMFVMTVSKKVPGITNLRFRRFFITAIRLANALLLCSLACAAFAAAFVVLRYRVFEAFAPLVVSGIISFLLQFCTEANNNRRENQDQEQIKAVEDVASKVTTATFGVIMSVLGASIGDKDKKSNKHAGATEMFMIVLTSAFVSGSGFMLLAAAPGSARARLAPAANVFVCSSVALLAAAAVAVYGVVVWTL